MLTRGPLYYTGASYVVNNSWDLTSYNSTYGVNAGSTYFSFIQMGQLFKSASFSNSSGNITNTLDPLDGWRLPTQDEWTTILGTSRAGSTIDGGSTKRHYAYIRLTGVTYCGDSTPEGLLLFPDNKAITGVSLSYLDNTTVNTGVTVSKLNSLIEQGCVFLPMGGYSNDGTWSRGGERGYFWSTIQNNSSTAKYAYIVTGTAPGIGSSSWNKSSYHSLVYLVRTPD